MPESSINAVTVTSPNDFVLHHMGSFVPTLDLTPHKRLVSGVVFGASVVSVTAVASVVDVLGLPQAARPDNDTSGTDAKRAERKLREFIIHRVSEKDKTHRVPSGIVEY